MPLLFILVLAAIQGITEFLPISSSGHLEIGWQAMAGSDIALPPERERLTFFIAVHLGTLAAVLLYFWRDALALAVGAFRLLTGRGGPRAKLLVTVIVGSLPLIAAGLLVKDRLLDSVYDLEVIAWANIGFAILLFVGDRLGMTLRRIEHLDLPSVLAIGCAQVLALIPGTSRSGITMTAGRFLGMERAEAARFSLLLAIPAILGAATLEGYGLYRGGTIAIGSDLAMATGLAFVAALVAIVAMMAWLKRASFTPFVLYRIALGAVLLWMIGEGLLDRTPLF